MTNKTIRINDINDDLLDSANLKWDSERRIFKSSDFKFVYKPPTWMVRAINKSMKSTSKSSYDSGARMQKHYPAMVKMERRSKNVRASQKSK